MKTLVVIVIFCAASSAHAQVVNVAALDDDTNVISVNAGAEYGLVVGVGYGRVQSVADRQLVIGVDLALGHADVANAMLSAHVLAPIVEGSRWRVLGELSASLRGAENDIGRFAMVGGDVAILAGRYAPRGLIALELGLDAALATHVTHAETYRMTVYEDAKDGWYGAPGATLRAGLQGGVSVGRHDLILRAGRMINPTGDPPLVPIYATLAFDARW
jgi:hypothetical protein